MKKKNLFMLLIVAVITVFAFKGNVYADDITCSALPNVQIDSSIPDLISTIIKVIWIVVPVLLVLLGSIDLVKGIIAQKEDEIKKGQSTFIKRLIAGAVVFFVIAIVKLLISAVAHDDNVMSCACYFIEGSSSSNCQ